MISKEDAISSVIHAFYPRAYAKWLSQRHVKETAKHLGKDEWPEGVLFGTPSAMGSYGGLWATNKRLLWVHHGFLGLTIKDYTYEQISSIEFSRFPGANSLLIRMSGGIFSDFLIWNPDPSVASQFTELVRAKMAALALPASGQPKRADLVAQLERLSALKNQGLLTEEEFEAAKLQVLN